MLIGCPCSPRSGAGPADAVGSKQLVIFFDIFREQYDLLGQSLIFGTEEYPVLGAIFLCDRRGKDAVTLGKF